MAGGLLERSVELRQTDAVVSWLPMYHDMGLIGSWLFCLYHGTPITLLSPVSFLARPERWLWAIHQRWATLSAAPNFAYELCVRRIPDRAIEGLDLSSWRCALNGAEPVSPDTLDRFARRFERYRFRREAFMPVYGLAECSVALCFPLAGRPPRIDRVARHPFERDPEGRVHELDLGRGLDVGGKARASGAHHPGEFQLFAQHGHGAGIETGRSRSLGPLAGGVSK